MNQLQHRGKFGRIDQCHRGLAPALDNDRLQVFAGFVEYTCQLSPKPRIRKSFLHGYKMLVLGDLGNYCPIWSRGVIKEEPKLLSQICESKISTVSPLASTLQARAKNLSGIAKRRQLAISLNSAYPGAFCSSERDRVLPDKTELSTASTLHTRCAKLSREREARAA
jgi:hypothetical protein